MVAKEIDVYCIFLEQLFNALKSFKEGCSDRKEETGFPESNGKSQVAIDYNSTQYVYQQS